jgi:uncharacterized protein
MMGSNEVVLVTGASSGIGEALARRAARDGRNVALTARRTDRLEETAAEIRTAFGVDTHVLTQDLSDPSGAAALAAQIADRGLVVDWLVNNAGFGTHGRFADMPLGRELQEIRLNVMALVELTHRFLPGMLERRRGLVMNLASVGAYIPSPYMATYTATKAFVLAFSEALAVETKNTGVSVLCVCPGFTRTEFQKNVEEGVAGRAPDFAWMSASEVADEAVRNAHRSGVLVSGLRNRVTTAMLKLTPRSAIAAMAGAMLRPSQD